MPKTIAFGQFRQLWDCAPESLRPVLALDVPVFNAYDYTLQDGTIRAIRAAIDSTTSELFATVARRLFAEPVDFSRIRSGSKVRIAYTTQHCYGIKSLDLSRPVSVVLYKSPFFIDSKAKMLAPDNTHDTFCIFIQGENLCAFSANGSLDYITEVVEY